VLSEADFPYKLKADAKFKAQELENLNLALKFTLEDCGVQMTLKYVNRLVFPHMSIFPVPCHWVVSSACVCRIGDSLHTHTPLAHSTHCHRYGLISSQSPFPTLPV